MIISLSAVPSESDKETFLSGFHKFGKCSIDFQVIPNKETHTVVSFVNEKNAQKAFDSLNKSILGNLKLDLTLLEHKSESLSLKTSNFFSKVNKKVSPDIEILIPSKPITFEFNSNPLLTPTGSYYSPSFPEVYQDNTESPTGLRENFDIVYDESPLSVIRLPVVSNVWDAKRVSNFTGNINEVYTEGDDCDGVMENRGKRKKIGRGADKVDDVLMCAVCGRKIKRGSIGAHNKSKVHLLNLKMSK